MPQHFITMYMFTDPVMQTFIGMIPAIILIALIFKIIMVVRG